MKVLNSDIQLISKMMVYFFNFGVFFVSIYTIFQTDGGHFVFWHLLTFFQKIWIHVKHI